MDCYLEEVKDVSLSVPGQVTLDICPKVLRGLQVRTFGAMYGRHAMPSMLGQ